jgi:hypothetical protein
MSEVLRCPSCKGEITTRVFLENCRDYFDTTHTVTFHCPLCDQSTDARIGSGRISFGYLYAAGSPHFCGMIDVSVEGISLERADDGIAVVLDQTRFEVRSVQPRR